MKDERQRVHAIVSAVLTRTEGVILNHRLILLLVLLLVLVILVIPSKPDALFNYNNFAIIY